MSDWQDQAVEAGWISGEAAERLAEQVRYLKRRLDEVKTESRQRELHHFETEQENARLQHILALVREGLGWQEPDHCVRAVEAALEGKSWRFDRD